GQAMERLAPWMSRIRDRVFLGAKTRGRTRASAWENIRECMRRLNVESFDLFQLHAVVSMEELDQATGDGGALEALQEMREQGLTRWIGITGHGPDVPRVHIEALRRFDFDTVMFPVNAAMYANPDYRLDAEELLALAASRDVGIQVIKMLARGGWGDRPHDSIVWYDPHRSQEDIDRAVWWQFSQSIHTAPSSGDPNLLPKVLDAAQRFAPLGREEQEEVVAGQSPPLPEPKLAILGRDS
ncbi:MAG: aldo/keto reductase, partial [SAR202 cluster bacterium]|nr:aldo/keto reductase [SAR202 cluster bacterium]